MRVTQTITFLVKLYFKIIWKTCLFSCTCTSTSVKLAWFVWKRAVGSSFCAAAMECEPMVTALGTHLVVERILSHLPIEDLKSCSLVNRFWKETCRSVLRTYKKCKITLGMHVCLDLQRLNEVLGTSTDLPFIGLRLKAWMPNSRQCEKYCSAMISQDIVSLYPHLFHKLPLKYLKIDHLERQNCVGEIFLHKLLTSRVPKETEYLYFMQWPKNIPSLWEYLNISTVSSRKRELDWSNYFKSLTTFHMCNGVQNRALLIWEVIRSAPKLRHIYGFIHPGMLLECKNFIGPHELPQISKPSWHLLRWVNVFYASQLYWLVEVNPKLVYFGFSPTVMQLADVNEESKIKECLSTVATRNRMTLKKLRSHEATHLLHLIVNQGPFLNLHVLLLEFNPNYRTFEDNILLLQTIDYTNFLPKLSNVHVSVTERQFFPEEVVTKPVITDYALVQQSAQHRCLTVTKLKLDWFGIYWATALEDQLQLWLQLAEVFPNVKAFAISDLRGDWSIWKELHKPWNDLESVSCVFFDETYPFLPFVAGLLEELTCNVGWEELAIITDGNQLQKWSYAASRVTFCEKTRVSNISIRLTHQSPCNPFIDSCHRFWRNRFRTISSWIRTKFPEFTLRVSFDDCACGQYCNPVYWHLGPIRKENDNDYPYLHYFQNNWVLSFTN